MKKTLLITIIIFGATNTWASFTNGEPSDCFVDDSAQVAKYQAQVKYHEAVNKKIKNQKTVDYIVAETAKQVYKKINSNWTYPEHFGGFSTESDYFDTVKIKVGNYKIGMLKRTKKEGTYKEAIQDLINKPAKLECLTASAVATIASYISILGEVNFEKVVKYYDAKIAPKFNVSPDEKFFTLRRLFIQTKDLSKECPKGHIWGFSNVHNYFDFKPNGYSSNHNVICVGKDKYYGFSPEFFKNGPRSEKKISLMLREKFVSDKGVLQNRKKEHARLARRYKKNYKAFRSSCLKAQRKKTQYINTQIIDNVMRSVNQYL